MSTISYYSMTDGEIQAQANVGKDMVLDALVADKVISAEQADTMKRTYVVLVTKLSWLSRLFKGGDDEKPKYVMTKCSPPLNKP